MVLAQRQTTGENQVVVGTGGQDTAGDEQQQRVRLEVLGATADDQRRVRWREGGPAGSGSWSQRGGRVKVKGLRSFQLLEF